MAIMPQTSDTLAAVRAEVREAFQNWGVQNHPSTPDPKHRYTLVMTERNAKLQCEKARKNGRLTWAHILVEEVAEAVDAPTPQERIAELVQVAAMAVAWIDSIQRNELGAA